MFSRHKTEIKIKMTYQWERQKRRKKTQPNTHTRNKITQVYMSVKNETNQTSNQIRFKSKEKYKNHYEQLYLNARLDKKRLHLLVAH